MSNVLRVDCYLRDIESDSVTLTAMDDAGPTLANPKGIKDLTGFTASAKVRLTRATAGTILTLTNPVGIQLLTGLVEDNVKVFWTPASKATIRAALVDTVGVWGLSLIDGSANPYVIAEGDMNVSLSVPR